MKDPINYKLTILKTLYWKRHGQLNYDVSSIVSGILTFKMLNCEKTVFYTSTKYLYSLLFIIHMAIRIKFQEDRGFIS